MHLLLVAYLSLPFALVDDEYIIVGSANINQRSMDGGRDTEIAMGAYQPHHLNTSNQVARGRVHGFRMSLWHEHLNSIENQFLDPASLACVQRVNKLADDNWSRYARDMLDGDLPGHLLAYPITVARSGAVKDLVDNFPDTEAQVCGKKSGNLVSMLTA